MLLKPYRFSPQNSCLLKLLFPYITPVTDKVLDAQNNCIDSMFYVSLKVHCIDNDDIE